MYMYTSVAVTIEWLHMASVIVELTINLYCSSSLAILPPFMSFRWPGVI